MWNNQGKGQSAIGIYRNWQLKNRTIESGIEFWIVIRFRKVNWQKGEAAAAVVGVVDHDDALLFVCLAAVGLDFGIKGDEMLILFSFIHSFIHSFFMCFLN